MSGTSKKLHTIHPLDKHLGLQLRKLRKLRGLSQEILAQRVGITFQQIQKYEKGTNSLNCVRLLGIAQALDTSVLYFFEEYEALGSREALHHASSSYLLKTKRMLQLTQLYSQLRDDPLQKAFIDLLRSVVKDDKAQEPV